jgi:rhamnulokinase
VHQAADLSGTPVETVHIVGGGAQNRLLCQLLADRVERPVIAGPVEATAIGNVLIQARAHGVISGDLEALRAALKKSEAATLLTETYVPQRSPAGKASHA